MGAVRHSLHLAGRDFETRVAAAAVTATILEVLVRRQILPRGLQCLKRLDLDTRQSANTGCAKDRKPLVRQRGVEQVWGGQGWLQRLLGHSKIREVWQKGKHNPARGQVMPGYAEWCPKAQRLRRSAGWPVWRLRPRP
jgi:hypothetical protein